MDAARPLTLAVPGSEPVSALLDGPPAPRLCLVLAHGAGAGMAHPFLAAIARGLAERGIATLRYQFPFMEGASRRPDTPTVAHATVRAAVAEAAARCPGAVLVAGGKSFGGRMTSQAQALAPLPGVAGLAFLGFPLHPPGRPSLDRAAHLDAVGVPMLFLQGTRDELADPGLIAEVAGRLGGRASLHLLDDADHAFHVRARSGRDDAAVRAEMLDLLAAWMSRRLGEAPTGAPADGGG